MKLLPWTLLFTPAFLLCLAAADASAPVENPGFEQGLDGWIVQRGELTTPGEAAHEGRAGLRIDGSENATISARPIPIDGGKRYILKLWIRGVENSHAGIELSFSDGSGRPMDLENAESFKKPMPTGKEWKAFRFEFTAPEAVSFLRLKLGVWPKKDAPAVDTVDIDEVEVAEGDVP